MRQEGVETLDWVALNDNEYNNDDDDDDETAATTSSKHYYYYYHNATKIFYMVDFAIFSDHC